MGRPGRRQTNRGWCRVGPDARRHQLTPTDRHKGGVQSYGLLVMERPQVAWWVLNTRIRPQARHTRDALLRRLLKDGAV